MFTNFNQMIGKADFTKKMSLSHLIFADACIGRRGRERNGFHQIWVRSLSSKMGLGFRISKCIYISHGHIDGKIIEDNFMCFWIFDEFQGLILIIINRYGLGTSSKEIQCWFSIRATEGSVYIHLKVTGQQCKAIGDRYNSAERLERLWASWESLQGCWKGLQGS